MSSSEYQIVKKISVGAICYTHSFKNHIFKSENIIKQIA